MSEEQTGFEARIELAGILAPEFRNASEALKRRRIKVVDKDGNVKAEITGKEFLEGAAKRVALEFDTFEDDRRRVICKKCKNQFVAHGKGTRAYCDTCKSCSCGRTLSSNAVARTGICAECYSASKRKPVPKCTSCGEKVSSKYASHCAACSLRTGEFSIDVETRIMLALFVKSYRSLNGLLSDVGGNKSKFFATVHELALAGKIEKMRGMISVKLNRPPT